MHQLCNHRDMKYAGSLESTQEATELLSAMPLATFMHLLCYPNFLHLSYLDEHTLTHEPIIIVYFSWVSSLN